MDADAVPGMGTRKLSRRAFVQGSVATGLLLGAPVVACTSAPVFSDALLLRPELLDAFGLDGVQRLGRAYREGTPQESTATALREAIERTVREDRDSPWSAVPTLEALVARDFAADRVLLVDGWLLSVTEARQCALASLS